MASVGVRKKQLQVPVCGVCGIRSSTGLEARNPCPRFPINLGVWGGASVGSPSFSLYFGDGWCWWGGSLFLFYGFVLNLFRLCWLPNSFLYFGGGGRRGGYLF